jgi:hypothetical protein
MSRLASTRAGGRCARTSKKSQIERQNPSRSVTDQRHSWS